MGGTVVAALGTVPRVGDDRESTAAWLASGLAGLTGRADSPALLPPAPIIDAIVALVADAPVEEPLALLGERAALAARTRAGALSCGSSARLLRSADGWLAVNLARPEDIDLVPAWLRLGSPPEDAWATVTEAVRRHPVVDLRAAAVELGLPVSIVGEVPGRGRVGSGRRSEDGPAGGLRSGGGEVVVAPLATSGLVGADERGRSGSRVEDPPAEGRASVGDAPRDGIFRRAFGRREGLEGPPMVVDLSSLWAGPLCSHLLALGGARVVKVESTRRPDGGRRDETGFFDLLNLGKASVALDLPSTHGLARLRSLLRAADVVIEGSRPRALRGWGIDAEAYLAADDGPRVWVSITGHGREGAAADRVGFGDDAAAAGGLVVWDDDGPCFLADAVADPLTGIAAAQAVGEALAEGGTWLLDAALARVAASVAQPGPAVPLTEPVPAPRSRPIPGPARPLGADTDAILAELS